MLGSRFSCVVIANDKKAEWVGSHLIKKYITHERGHAIAITWIFCAVCFYINFWPADTFIQLLLDIHIYNTILNLLIIWYLHLADPNVHNRWQLVIPAYTVEVMSEPDKRRLIAMVVIGGNSVLVIRVNIMYIYLFYLFNSTSLIHDESHLILDSGCGKHSSA